ncbi:MAG: hypothetical protein EOP02_31440 [Proteobacteria bacterium]|nr:MAG: hypothetical protein EOP02_31440 [Pseudomonadota bacterium]
MLNEWSNNQGRSVHVGDDRPCPLHPTSGEAMLGEIGIATEDFNGVEGTIRIDGELWTAEAPPGTSVKRGDKLGVTARDGLKLSVRALPL